jgi:hypothetical protein
MGHDVPDLQRDCDVHARGHRSTGASFHRRAPPTEGPESVVERLSTGRWDGDMLVVETNGFQDGQWLDGAGSPLTEAAKMTEKFRRPNYGSLQIEMTVDNPKACTKPWNTELLDYICLENEKNSTHLVGEIGPTSTNSATFFSVATSPFSPPSRPYCLPRRRNRLAWPCLPAHPVRARLADE